MQSPVWSYDEKGGPASFLTRPLGDLTTLLAWRTQFVWCVCLNLRKATSYLVFFPHFSSITVEPVGRFSVESVHPSTPLFQSLALRRKCACASPALSSSTSKSTDTMVKA